MAASPGHQIPASSFHVIKTQVAVLLLAPFSPGRDLKRLIYSTRHRHTKAQRAFLIPRTGPGFESQEPTSPKVGCLGQIKLKQKWGNASKQRAKKKSWAKFKLSKLRKFIFGSRGRGRGGGCGEGKLSKLRKFFFGSRGGVGRGNGGEVSENCPTEEGCRAPSPTLGRFKRYASASYDARFGDMFSRREPFAAPSGWHSD